MKITILSEGLRYAVESGVDDLSGDGAVGSPLKPRVLMDHKSLSDFLEDFNLAHPDALLAEIQKYLDGCDNCHLRAHLGIDPLSGKFHIVV